MARTETRQRPLTGPETYIQDHLDFFDKGLDREYARERLAQVQAHEADFWINRLRKHHEDTQAHCYRVGSDLAAIVCHVIGKDGSTGDLSISIYDIELMGRLHDIGKLTLDTKLLDKGFKPGSTLTPEEYGTIKTHTRAGYELLKHTLPIAACAAGKHHPSYAVKEWPDGLRKDAKRDVQPLLPYLTLADFCDALLTRKNGKYATLDTSDTRAVKQVLLDAFPTLEDAITPLLRNRGYSL